MSSLLPPNATTAELALEAVVSRTLPVEIGAMRNPDTCPANLLPWLAWELSVDSWDTNWTEAQKRGAIKASVEAHKVKGTIGAMRAAVGGLGYDLDAIEWFQLEPAGDPYTFGLLVTINDDGITSGAYDQIEAVALGSKNLRSHLTGVDVVGEVSGTLYIGAACLSGETIEVFSETETLVLNEFALAAG